MSQNIIFAPITVMFGAAVVLINCSLLTTPMVKTGDRAAAADSRPVRVQALGADVNPLAAVSLLADQAPATADYTGILIDGRDLPNIMRSPAPAIYGPAPDFSLLYPDRSHVPTPDEVQDESIVRYYHTESEAEKGVAGDHPLILKAIAVLGNAKDALELNADDAARLQDLDKKLHFSRTWKVGFLIPANQ